MSEIIRVLVVDDNSLLRLGLTEAISGEPDMEAVGEADNGEEAVELYAKLLPDVVTMDYQMPGGNGVEATRRITEQFPDAKVLLLSVYEGEEDIWNAVQAGAQGYLNKSGEIEEVLDAIREVGDGGRYFPVSIAKKLASREERENLTAREHQVLELVVEGNSNKEIMKKLKISEGTVKLHVSHILDKLGAADRTQAAVIAVKQGIVHLND